MVKTMKLGGTPTWAENYFHSLLVASERVLSCVACEDKGCARFVESSEILNQDYKALGAAVGK